MHAAHGIGPGPGRSGPLLEQEIDLFAELAGTEIHLDKVGILSRGKLAEAGRLGIGHDGFAPLEGGKLQHLRKERSECIGRPAGGKIKECVGCRIEILGRSDGPPDTPDTPAEMRSSRVEGRIGQAMGRAIFICKADMGVEPFF
ncbi:MAG: hypothetical protein ACK5LJ_17775 [Paracoccus sp. (in: a-proteobacteria)]